MPAAWTEVENSQDYQKLPANEQQAAKTQYFSEVVAKKPEFQTLPDEEKQAASSQFMGNSEQKQLTPMQDVFKSQKQGLQDVSNFITNSVLKTATGKGFSDRMTEGIPTDTKDMSIPQMLGTNLKRAALQTTGEFADMFTSPLSIGLMLYGPISKLPSKIVDIRKNLSDAALSPEFAQNKADFKYGHDARRVMQSMPDIHGGDINSTGAAIENKLQETGKAIGDTIANSPKSVEPVGVNDADISKPFDDKIAELNKADPAGNRRTIRALEAKRVSLLNNFDETGNPTGPVEFENLNQQQLHDYKGLKLSNIKYTGRQGVDESALNDSLQEVRRNIVSKQNATMPELKPLNQDYGDLISAKRAVDDLAFKAQKEGFQGTDWKDIVGLGINNPINRIRLARFLYTAPKEDVIKAATSIPDFGKSIAAAFGENYKPALGIAGKVGFENISKGGEVPAEIVAGRGGAQLPAPETPVYNRRISQKIGFDKPAIPGENPVKRISDASGVKQGAGFTMSKNVSQPDTGAEALKMEAEGGPVVKGGALGNKGSAKIKTLEPAAIAGAGTAAVLGSNKVGQENKIQIGNNVNNKKAFEGQKFTGNASTYNWGEKGLNDTTADGKAYMKNSPTESFAAMRNVPLGSTVEVRDLRTGKNIEVEVRDFGPGKRVAYGNPNRVIDLSQGALRQLGYKKAQNISVNVTVKKVGTGGRYNGKY